ncbi:hypothetical protein ACOSP7_028546 [Xanthoceras sorbifolium]|uniref:Transcription termination factor MTEF18, mitochondrial-like n=1 Tax=Xanthoceras sorbifolium TaxID=99658 RepID=A0ABQ8HD05_9ROSI|nr:hypothetical protein JRO89_XS12G0158300 [Xanthoceras sorbifolium]
MIHLQKLRTISILKWVSSNFVENHVRSSKTPFELTGSFYIAQNPRRLYGRKRIVKPQNVENVDDTSLACDNNVRKVTPAIRREAEAALLEYLHSTRSLQFTDAEHMSKNSPLFLEKILEKIKDEGNIRQSTVRYLRYHPINEFEPFFESAGLKPCEYNPLLPRNLMYLSDDDLLLKNYHVFCNYGIERNKIGKIYKGAMEVFRNDFGILLSKLQAYEELGLSQSFIRKVIVCSPHLLIGDANVEFVKVIEMLKNMGIEFSWIEEHLEPDSCNWSMMFSFLSLFSQIGSSEKPLSRVIRQHPGLLLEGSGDRALTLIGLLLKFGFAMNEIFSIFLQVPQIQVGKFVSNLRQCVQFLNEIEMEMEEIVNIVHSHPILLGSCTLKKTDSLLVILNVGKKRLCKYIQENPQEIKKWVMGTRVGRLPRSGEKERSQILKTKFLLELGFVENSKQMEKALKFIRAKGEELQERFDCIVEAGMDRKDVCEMIIVAPHILNQTKDVIKMKIDFLVNELGYPISFLSSFPSYLTYTVQRINLRFFMYNWLKDQGLVDPKLAGSTVMTCSDNTFLTRYVNPHPKGPQVWRDLRKQICSE